MKGDVFIQEISEYRHSFLPECPRIRSSTGYTCLQEQLTEPKQKNVASPSTNAAEKKKEKKRQTSAKFFVLQAHAITETRNIKTIENQLLRIKKLHEL